MKKQISGIALGMMLAAGSASIAQSATATGTMNVSMTVSALCTVSASALAFTSTSFMSAAADTTSTLTVRCTQGTFYYITMGLGANSTGTPAVRRMRANTADFLNYELYTDAGRTTAWLASVTTAPTASVPVAGAPSATGNGANQTYTVFGRVPVQNAVPGNYADTVTVTVTY